MCTFSLCLLHSDTPITSVRTHNPALLLWKQKPNQMLMRWPCRRFRAANRYESAPFGPGQYWRYRLGHELRSPGPHLCLVVFVFASRGTSEPPLHVGRRLLTEQTATGWSQSDRTAAAGRSPAARPNTKPARGRADRRRRTVSPEFCHRPAVLRAESDGKPNQEIGASKLARIDCIWPSSIIGDGARR